MIVKRYQQTRCLSLKAQRISSKRLIIHQCISHKFGSKISNSIWIKTWETWEWWEGSKIGLKTLICKNHIKLTTNQTTYQMKKKKKLFTENLRIWKMINLSNIWLRKQNILWSNARTIRILISLRDITNGQQQEDTKSKNSMEHSEETSMW